MPVHIDIKLKEGVWIDPKSFIDRIDKAGYQARKDDIVLKLSGTLSQEEGKLILAMQDVKPGPQKFILSTEMSRKPAESESFAQAYKRAAELAGQKVEIEGRWTPPAKGAESASLAVRSVNPLKT